LGPDPKQQHLLSVGAKLITGGELMLHEGHSLKEKDTVSQSGIKILSFHIVNLDQLQI